LEPVDAVVGPDHPLADATSLKPTDLRAGQLLLPAAPARLEFLQRFAERFELTSLVVESNLGAEHFLARLAGTPAAVTLLPADVPPPAWRLGGAPRPAVPGLRAIPLVDPTPLYAWSLVWPEQTRHPGIPALLRAFAEAGRHRRWLEYHPERDWLPEAESAELRAAVR
jgi:hypothetical protein